MTRPSCPVCGSPVNATGASACWRHRPVRRPKTAAKPRGRSGHRDPVSPGVWAAVRAADGWACVGPRAGLPGVCSGPMEMDHVWSGGLRLRGPSIPANLVSLCASHHRWKTDHSRVARRMLAEAIPRLVPPEDRGRIVDNSGTIGLPDPGPTR